MSYTFCCPVAGIEISDVLKIDDKDYSITYSLYFNVEWYEPRLQVNLSSDFWGPEGEMSGNKHLVPGNPDFVDKKCSIEALDY